MGWAERHPGHRNSASIAGRWATRMSPTTSPGKTARVARLKNENQVMAVARKGNGGNEFGKIEIADEGIVSFVNRPSKTTMKAACQKWTWIPSRKLRKHLPKKFTLTFQCITGTDGLRRVYPDLPFARFFPPAWQGGLAVMI